MQKFRFLIVIFIVWCSVVWGAELRKLGSNDLEWATPNQGVATTTTSPQGKVVTKIDAAAVPFRSATGYVDNLVNGSYSVTLKPYAIVGNGGTLSGLTLGTNTVTSNSIAAGSILSSHLAAGSVTEDKIPALSIPPGKLQASSWSATGTKFYRDDGSWAAAGGGGDNIVLPITGPMIDNGTLSLPHFPYDLRPVKGVDALPGCLGPDYPAGAVVYLRTDHKLYTCLDNGSWQTVVYPYDISGVITDNQLNPGIIGIGAFAATIRPVQLVSADPTLPNASYPAGSVIFNIASNMLKKTLNGLTWDNVMTSFNASGISGQLTAEQIAAVNAASIAGQLTSDQIASLDGSKIVGEIWATEIADNSVTTPKLVAGAVTTNKIAALSITSDLLAANSVVAGKVSANAVEAGNIAANAVTSNTIAANAVVAGKVSAGAIGATEIAAGAIVSGKIATDAIVANNILAGQINASHLATDSVTANKIQAGAVSADKIAANTITGDRLAVHNSVASDGNYLVSTGWSLNPTGLVSRFPTPTSTYFYSDGQIHAYAWNGSSWTETANIGRKTEGSDYDSIYAYSDVSRGHAVSGRSDGQNGDGVRGSAYNVGGAGVRGYSAQGYSVYANVGGLAPLALGVSGSTPPSHTAVNGAIWANTNGNLFINVNGGGGYSAWKTVGIASTDLSAYDLAVGSACISAAGTMMVKFPTGWRTMQWV